MKRTPAADSALGLAGLAPHGPLILMAIAAFLAPLLGGYVSVDVLSLEPGYAPTMRAIFGGGETPILSHFVLALLVCAASVWVLVSRRVVQVPMAPAGMLALVFFALVAVSVIYSGYPFVSWESAFEWLAYAAAFFGAIAVVGRRSGPSAVLGAFFAGASLQGLLGVWEYLALRSDPTWRIFGTWQNPNALAAILLLGFFIGCGLLMASRRTGTAFAIGAGNVTIALALALTQSKGAYFAAIVGLVFVFALSFVWLAKGPQKALASLIRVAACLIVLIGLLMALRARGGDAGGAAPLARMAQAESSQDQSAGFRMLLWRGAVSLIKEKPLGWGLGSYRFESARPGLTTQTHLAHNSYLQLGVEAGVLAPLALLGLGGVWLYYSFKGSRRQSAESLTLKIGVVAAVAAGAVHNAVDSDLYYFGFGLVFFLLLGIGAQLNADGNSPESVQPGPRWTAFAIALMVPIALFYFGAVEITKAHIRWHLEKRLGEPALEGARALNEIAGADGEGWYLRALLEPDPRARQAFLAKAAERMPSTRNLRMLARAEEQAGDPVKAAGSLNRALQADPHNLFTLKLLLDVYLNSKNEGMADEAARRLVDVESTPYFRIRALPELVPTETYFARRYLAQREEDPKKRQALLEPALEGLLEYARRTVPNVAASVKEGLPQGYGGETAESAREKMELGKDVARKLAAAYRQTLDAAKAAEVETKAAKFDEALASLG